MATISLLLHPVPSSPGTSIQARQKRGKVSRTKPAEEVPIPTAESSTQEKESSRAAPAKREAVLNACFITSAGLAAAGLAARQGSHVLTSLKYLSSDCTELLPYEIHPWHFGVTFGLVVFMSALRLGFLAIWPDFARSTQASNERILSSLGPVDCAAVAFSSGVSEELLFRGALLPLVGMDIRGVLVSGIVFGALHITGGRSVSFATWASFVGVAYGLAAVWTSDLCVPMLAHSSANLVAALYWKYTTSSGGNGNAGLD